MKNWNDLSMAEKADVMKLAVEGGVYDLNTIRSGYNSYASGGGIHIDPSKKGTFTAAASRHGMGVQEFASKVLAHKENYSTAMVKKANFARNASKWHGLGGNLFDDGGDKDNNPNIFKYTNKLGDVRYVYQATPESEEIDVRPLDTTPANPVYWTFIDDSGRQYTPRVSPTIPIAELNPDNRGSLERAWDNYIGEAINTVPKGYHTLPAIAAAAALPYAGEALANPFVDYGLTSAFAGHGLSKIINGEVDGPVDAVTTALEVLPAARVAKPVYKDIKGLVGKIGKTANKTPKPIASRDADLIWDAEQMFRDGNNNSYTQEDIDILNSFIPEYKKIERASKTNGTYLKMPDGSTWKGDPREWVLAQSNNVKANYGDEILTHGNSKSWIDKNGTDITGDVLGRKTIWTSTNPYLGDTYGNKVYRFVIPKDADIKTVVDAEGRFFRDVKPGIDTDMFVYPNITENNVVRINNVVDRGSSNLFSNKFPKNLPNEDIVDYTRRIFTGDDLVLGENVRRKALLGNNGMFNINNSNIFKGLLPIGLGTSIGTYYETSK